MLQVLRRTHTRDLGRRLEQGVGNLAGHHVGFVGARDGQDQIASLAPACERTPGVRRIADYRAHIQVVLEHAETLRVAIDDGDVVGFARESLRDGAADLPARER